MTHRLTGEVIGVYLARDPAALRSSAEPSVQVTFAGFAGDRHAGLTCLSGGRSRQYPRGTEIRNSRQVSIVSVEELDAIAQALDVPALRAEWLGANLLLRGIPQLTLLPPGTRLFFAQDATLVVESENHPCAKTGSSIQEAYPAVTGLAQAFPGAAMHRRGLVAWVERPGAIAAGDPIRAELPEQRLYPLP